LAIFVIRSQEGKKKKNGKESHSHATSGTGETWPYPQKRKRSNHFPADYPRCNEEKRLHSFKGKRERRRADQFRYHDITVGHENFHPKEKGRQFLLLCRGGNEKAAMHDGKRRCCLKGEGSSSVQEKRTVRSAFPWKRGEEPEKNEEGKGKKSHRASDFSFWAKKKIKGHLDSFPPHTGEVVLLGKRRRVTSGCL